MLRPESSRPLRDRLTSERLTGTFLKLPATESVDLAASAGYDFIVVDLEHSQLSDGDAIRLLRHAHALRLPALARVPTCDRGLVNRLLEAGGQGIQLSSVRSVAEVRALVSATRYPPKGDRSISLAHPAAGYGSVPLAQAVTRPAPLVVGQIESAETDDPLEEVLMAGLDVAFVGMTDLEVDVGFDSVRLSARVQEIRGAARAAGVTLGMFVARPPVPQDVPYVALSSDVALLRSALAESLTRAVEG